MKTKVTLFIGSMTIFACLFVYSCKKLDSKVSADTNELSTDLLEAASEWHAIETHTTNPLSINTNQAHNILLPIWKNAKVQKLYNGKNIVVVPGPTPNIGENSTYGVTRKFVFTTKGKKILTGEIIEMYGDADYIKSHEEDLIENYYNNKTKDFTGAAIIYDVNYNRLISNSYKDGEWVNANATIKYINGQFGSNNKGNITTLSLGDCTNWYLVTHYSDGSTSESFLGRTCSTGGGSNGEVGGSGGTNGSTTGLSLSVNTIQSIKNLIIDPCPGSIVDQLKSGSLQTSVTQIFRNTFGSTDDINVSFNYSPINSNDDGVTNGTRSISQSTDQVSKANLNITLNSNTLGSASKEYLAAVAIHEMFHAYLDVNNPTLNALSQHIYMAANYVNMTASTLRTMYPSLSYDDSMKISISGYGIIQKNNPDAYNDVLTMYNYSADDVSNLSYQYRAGITGTKC